ncbi:hypothetical protein A1D22_09125 [Pasteurellaceae bacterium LFhippo2]|nr:hypothetical protein [Pasteurellaceae bacterium LFhippo2]
MSNDKLKDLKKIAISIILVVIIVFILLLCNDKNSTLSEKVIASCTVGLLIVSIYGIIFQLGAFINKKYPSK